MYRSTKACKGLKTSRSLISKLEMNSLQPTLKIPLVSLSWQDNKSANLNKIHKIPLQLKRTKCKM